MSEHSRWRHVETAAVRTQAEQTHHREHSVPLYLTSSFTFEDAEQARAMFAQEVEGNIYSRFTNPNVDEFVDKMCALEGTEAGVATASGMSAVFTCFAALLDSGDEILSSRSVFGSTHQVLTQILPRWKIGHRYGALAETEGWRDLVSDRTRMVYVETPSNPTLELVDLDWLGAFCRDRNILMVVDNIFATPALQRPAEYGADIVIHSATKYIDGQGRGLGGVILGRKEVIDRVRSFARHSGPCLSPFNAWMFSKSLETLPLRMERHSDSAEAVARHLEEHEDVEKVYYPHLPSHPQYDLALKQMKRGGGMVSFIARGGVERGRRFLDAIRLSSLTANLGDTRTIVTHPASTTHSKLTEEERQAVGIHAGLVRVSVGLEHVDDVVADLDHALAQSRP